MNPAIARSFSEFVQRWRGWDHRAALAELERMQWEPAEAVEAVRMERLRELLRHCARNVPFYQDALRDAGLDPEQVRSAPDLRALPVVDKRSYRAGYERFFDRSGRHPHDAWVTSGSTGQPFAFRLDRRSIATNTFAALARGRRWWELDHGVREAMIWSGVRDVSSSLQGRVAAARRKLSWRLKNIVLIDIYNLDEAGVRDAYRRLVRFQPRLFRVISSGLYRFCVTLRELGLDGRALGAEAAIYTGEAFPPAQRRLVEEVLGCPTVCEYGCGELGIIAFQCPTGGLHLSHENMIFEFLHEGAPAAAGQPAELVVTNLNNFAAPQIRYAVGDVVVPSDARCACKRSMPLLESVGGRSHDAIRTPAGGTVHGLFFTHLFDDLPEVHQFRIVQERLDRLRVDLVAAQPIDAAALAFIRKSIRDELGGADRVEVEVTQVADLPLNRGGKTDWIVSELPPEVP